MKSRREFGFDSGRGSEPCTRLTFQRLSGAGLSFESATKDDGDFVIAIRARRPLADARCADVFVAACTVGKDDWRIFRPPGREQR